MKTNYSEYTVKISDDPSYYGSDTTHSDARRIVSSLTRLIQSEFPGINVEIAREDRSSSTTGPDEDTINQIDRWIENNWTAAL